MRSRNSENHQLNSWDDDNLRGRFQKAYGVSHSDNPSGIAGRAMATARQNHRRRFRGRTWLAVSGLIPAASFLLICLHLQRIDLQSETVMINPPSYSHVQPPVSGADRAKEQSAPTGLVDGALIPPRRATKITKRASPEISRDDHMAAESSPRFAESQKTDAPNNEVTSRIEQLKTTQARDFELAAGIMEEAGQSEPAYQLYSMSIETSPSLDATLGIARVVGQMDKDLMMSDHVPPAPSDDRSTTG